MKKNCKRILLVLTCLVMGMSVIPFISGNSDIYAAKKKVNEMKTYSQIIKKGNMVYCKAQCDMKIRIYRVNLNTSEVKPIMKYTLKEGGGASDMSLKKGYLYYTLSDDLHVGLYRIKTNGNNKKLLARIARGSKYALKGSTIYYLSKGAGSRGVMKKMNLNGKSKKTAKGYTIKMNRKKSNVNGYSIVKQFIKKEYDYSAYDPGDEMITVVKYYDHYLKTPDGRQIFLETMAESDYESL